MDSRTRRVGAGLALTLAVALLAAPTALATKPIRTVFDPPDPFFIPAGFGCAFDVLEETNAGSKGYTVTEFADGRVVTHAHGDATLTNLDSGTSMSHRARFNATDRIDMAANVVQVDIAGQVFVQFYPGDQGPFGEVSEPGGLYRFTGHIHITVDLDTFVYTAFAYNGTVIDICAVLGP